MWMQIHTDAYIEHELNHPFAHKGSHDWCVANEFVHAFIYSTCVSICIYANLCTCIMHVSHVLYIYVHMIGVWIYMCISLIFYVIPAGIYRDTLFITAPYDVCVCVFVTWCSATFVLGSCLALAPGRVVAFVPIPVPGATSPCRTAVDIGNSVCQAIPLWRTKGFIVTPGHALPVVLVW